MVKEQELTYLPPPYHGLERLSASSPQGDITAPMQHCFQQKYLKLRTKIYFKQCK